MALTAALFVVALSGPIAAQRGHGGGTANKPTAPVSHGPSGQAHLQQPATHPEHPQHPEHPTNGSKPTGNPHSTTPTTTTATAVTTSTPTTTRVHNPALEQRLQLLLPPTMTVADASKGFKNWGQFVAAVHVSHNLNIPFADLKAKMTGPTPMSLGQAIQTFPKTTTTTTATTEVKKAESEADDDFRVARNDTKH